MGKLALLLLLLFQTGTGTARAWLCCKIDMHLKTLPLFHPKHIIEGRYEPRFYPVQNRDSQPDSRAALKAAMEEADEETHSSGLQAWHRKAAPIAPSPCPGWKQWSQPTWTVHMPHLWQKHLYFLQLGPWETSDTAHELWFVCLGNNLFLMVVRDYRQEELWVLDLDSGRVR